MKTSIRPIIESCVDSVQSALQAAAAGADQIELCTALDVDGLSPPMEWIRRLKPLLSIPMKVMVRPRAGNFNYDRAELEAMQSYVKACADLAVDGIVIGALRADRSLDLDAIKMLSAAWPNDNITVHKCIDQCPSIMDALRMLGAIPKVRFVLSSGGAETAMEGYDSLNKMHRMGLKNIIAAGKIRYDNLDLHQEKIECVHFHGREIVKMNSE